VDGRVGERNRQARAFNSKLRHFSPGGKLNHDIKLIIKEEGYRRFFEDLSFDVERLNWA
jgi:hypothetical protein